MADHDSGYKRLFSHPEMMADLLRGFVREDWVADLDFASLSKYPTTFINDHLRERRDDVIWRVRRGNEDLYIYLLLEFQSSVNPYMVVRIFNYLGLLYQDLIHGGEIAADGCLPPVLPIILYIGRQRWNADQDIETLIAGSPGELAHYRPRLRYLLIDESAYAFAHLKRCLPRWVLIELPSAHEILDVISELARNLIRIKPSASKPRPKHPKPHSRHAYQSIT